MHFLYNLSIRLYSFIIRLVAPFHSKAALWIRGRRHVFEELQQWKNSLADRPVVWIHCASLGEFEQGRPVIEAIRARFPRHAILLSFFSPSGFEQRKNYPGADKIIYLPSDTVWHARKFVHIVEPSMALIVKYEYWANYFFECKRAGVPIFMISAILRPEQRFFGVLHRFWGNVLHCVDTFFVQNEDTLQLLKQHGFTNAVKCGDTRYDRVMQIAQQSVAMPELAMFVHNRFCIVGGSTWTEEENLLASYLGELSDEVKKKVCVIIVPHEIHDAHIQQILRLFPDAVLWSEWLESGRTLEGTVMVVNTMGMLSRIYSQGDVALIGGGFGKGIHNTLEAAVWGLPVLFGPNYYKFAEAIGLLDDHGAFVVLDEEQCYKELEAMRTQKGLLESCGINASRHVRRNAGATPKIISYLETNGFLR